MANSQKSGLDIDLGNLCSKDAFGWAKKTFSNRADRPGATALKVDGAFSNLLTFGQQRIGIASDGIGTKIELAERTGIYHTLGYDLVAMVADDLATAGFEPTNISNIIDVNRLDRDTINDLMRGLAEACTFAGMSISGGEIAELGDRIGGYGEGMHFNWCSTAIGTLPEQLDKPFDGTKVRAGQVVVALQARGFRSNGFSLIRRIMEAAHGAAWHQAAYSDEQTWGEALLTPSLIYTPLINRLIQSGVALAGVAHITGGGIADNLQRVLKTNGVGAELDGLHAPLPIMQRLLELGSVAAADAYLYWNMGNGMLLLAEEDQADRLLQQAADLDYHAVVAGRTTEEAVIRLHTPQTVLETAY